MSDETFTKWKLMNDELARLKAENAALHSRCVMEENELFRDLRAENERYIDALRECLTHGHEVEDEYLTIVAAVALQDKAFGADDDS